jgi:hypothetical protein
MQDLARGHATSHSASGPHGWLFLTLYRVLAKVNAFFCPISAARNVHALHGIFNLCNL